MKKSIFTIMALAAVAVSMISCQEKLVSGDVAFSMKTPAEVSLSGKEKIAISVDGSAPVVVLAENPDFTQALSNVPASGTIIAVSPFAEEGSGVNAISAKALDINMAAAQSTRAEFPDANAQILLAKAKYSGSLPSNLNLDFANIAANVKLVAKAPEALKSVTLQFSANVVGTFNYDIASGVWNAAEATNALTVKSSKETDTFFFGCAPLALEGEILAEFTGAVTGAKYNVEIPAAKMKLEAGKQTTVEVELPLQLYICGSAVGKESAAESIEMTKKADGSFTWTGDMAAESEYTFIFSKTSQIPAFVIGDNYNQIKYSSKATATPFENQKAGNYTITVVPSVGHVQVVRNFDHVLAAADGAGPMFEEFDSPEIVEGQPHDWETRFGPIWQNHGYDTFGVVDGYKLSGANSYWISVTWVPGDRNQGRIIRSGDWKQPIAVAEKTYTVEMQMMYEGSAESEEIVWRIEGALGTGAGYEESVVLEPGVPVRISKDFLSDSTWGGCVNFFVYFNKCNLVEDEPFTFYFDGLNIGYDD